MTREEAIKVLIHLREIIRTIPKALCKLPNVEEHKKDDIVAIDIAIASLSVNATKKRAELKENGDWDCPDVGCDECDHHRSVDWCSLAIPNHGEKIDETYKMVNEAFFEGFDAAEKRYKFLIETVEELEKKLAEPKWITDRKPTKSGTYMVTLDAFGQHRYIRLRHYGKPLLPNRDVKGVCWYRTDDEGYDVVYDDDEILAWMPLPKPYGGDGGE